MLLFAATLTAAALACGGGASEVAAPRATSTVRPASGPSARIEPRSGPAGTEITVSGSGWPADVEVIITSATAGSAGAYARVTTAGDGSFTAHFRLEKALDGAPLRRGRLDLVARSQSFAVPIAFLVETPRPVGGGSGSGG